ncbi:MAG: NAD(+) synthase, partial [Acidobacteria bacterium]|nr:NAD(+) synthase [Acidobacteriota bacterium]
ELVFDGHSMVIDPAGRVVARGAQFEEDLLVVDLDILSATRRRLHDPRWRQAGADRDRVRSIAVEAAAPTGPAEPAPPGEPADVPDAPLADGRGRHGVREAPGSEPAGGRHAAPRRDGPARPVESAPPASPTSDRRMAVRGPAPPRPAASAPRVPPLLGPEAEVYRALTLGTADYFRKNRFRHAVLGLSGGIDSALALTVAADALGPGAVTAVSMPSRFTAAENRDDARELADRLGVELLELPIAELAGAYDRALAGPFGDAPPNVAEENLQARIRGNLLMALSNKFGWLVLTTGNKSEMSVGYATLYGDIAGGFAVLKDVLKGWVYRLARWRNRDGEVIPQRIIDKPPTAELRENQLDTDSLPPYDVLDAVLEAYVEDDRSPEDIAGAGLDPALVDRIVAMVDGAEYKRRQAPPGVRISVRAFGRDRRLPITNLYTPRSHSRLLP